MPAAQLLRGNQQVLFKAVVQRLRREGNNTLESAGHKVGGGYPAQKSFGKIPGLKRVKDVQKVLLQGVVLVYKGKSDKHIAVYNLAGVIVVTAAAVGIYKADVKGRVVLTVVAVGAVNVNYTVFQAVVSAVVIVKIQPVRLIKGAFAVYLADGRLRSAAFRAVIGQLIDCYLQGIGNFHQRFDIDGDFAVFVFADGCAAFVNDIRQLLQSKPLLFAVFLYFAADIFFDIVQNIHLFDKYNISKK